MANGEVIKVLLIDDHAIVRAGLSLIIEKDAGLQIVGEAGSQAEALAAIQKVIPDVILLDIDLGAENGLDSMPALQAAAANARIIVLTGMRDTEMHSRAVNLGALGVINKENAQDVILQAIRRVYAGEAWLDPKLTATLLSQFTGANRKKEDPEAAKIASLSKRELEVVKLIGEGLKSKEIAERLFISEITVRHHLTSIFAKLEVSDRVELLLYSYKNGLAKAPA
jgi:DNA-binding NarL/FixJ family response regulator